MSGFNIEEAVGWNILRAAQEAVKNAPKEIPLNEDVWVSVEIRMHSVSWPGKTETGRSKSTIIGSAMCLYRGSEATG